jgi:hypothetical protein
MPCIIFQWEASMQKIVLPFTLLTAAVFLLPAAPAQALAARTFVSAAGSDSNNCTNVATPCRHLATAYAATSPNGEIYVLDPANYGSLTITGPVSIEGHGWASIAPPSGGNAITINANAGDQINIIGVVLDGTALATTNGIQFNSGGSLIVRDSVIRNFTNDGILFQPSATSELSISNTLIADNGGDGVFIIPTGAVTAPGVFDRVAIEHNASDGIHVQSNSANLFFTVSDSVIARNGLDGITTSVSATGFIDILVRNSAIANNGANGLSSNSSGNGSLIRVTRSSIIKNGGGGWFTSGNGAVSSYSDNNIDDNGSNNSTPGGLAGVYH